MLTAVAAFLDCDGAAARRSFVSPGAYGRSDYWFRASIGRWSFIRSDGRRRAWTSLCARLGGARRRIVDYSTPTLSSAG